jgi:hypothetical protein
MKCSEVEMHLSEYIDDEISPSARSLMKMHLAGCRQCREKLESLKSMTDQLGQIPRAAAPPDFINRLNERLDKETPVKKLRNLFLVPLKIKLPLELATAAALGILIFFIVQPPVQQPVTFKNEVDKNYSLVEKQKVQTGKKQPTQPLGRLPEKKPAFQPKAETLKDDAAPSPPMPYEQNLEIRDAKGKTAQPGEQMLAKSTVAESEIENVKENTAPPPILISLIIPAESKIPAARQKSAEAPVDRMEKSSKAQSIEQKIVQMLDSMGGKVVAMERNDEGQPLSANIEIPASKYSQFIDQILQIGKIESPQPSIAPTGDQLIPITISFVAQP